MMDWYRAPVCEAFTRDWWTNCGPISLEKMGPFLCAGLFIASIGLIIYALKIFRNVEKSKKFLEVGLLLLYSSLGAGLVWAMTYPNVV